MKRNDVLYLLGTLLIVMLVGSIGYGWIKRRSSLEGIEEPNGAIPIPSDGIISAGYYAYDRTYMAPIPVGLPTGAITFPVGGALPEGYYAVDGHFMAPVLPGSDFVPRGYYMSNGQLTLIPVESTAYDVSMASNTYVFDTSDTPPRQFGMNFDTQYHDSVDVIQQQNPITTMVLVNGVLTPMPWSDVSSNIGYYPDDYYKYGPTTYVPTYTDSVYLSRGSM